MGDLDALDGAVHALEPHVRDLFGSGVRGQLLRGDWLGHGRHPVLTDVVLGSWTSATVLDVLGRGRWPEAAQGLVSTGLVAFGPTVWTGWMQWSEGEPRDERVGLALAGAAVAKVGAHLGGHLTTSRHVGTHHPAFDATQSFSSASS